MAFNREAAKKAGYTDQEIESYLQSKSSTSQSGNPSFDTRAKTAGVDFLKGAGKGLASTLQGASQLGQKGLNATFGFFGAPKQPIASLPENLTTPSNTAQRVGFGAEQIAELLAPGGLATKAGKVTQAATAARTGGSLLPRVTGFLTRSGAEAGLLGGQTAMQTGEFGPEAKTAATIGAAVPLASKVVGALTKYVKNRGITLASIVTGEGTNAMKAVLENPKAADIAIQGGDAVMRSAVERGATRTKQMKNAFITAHSEAMKIIAQKAPKQVAKRSEIAAEFSRILREERVLVGIGKDKPLAKMNFAVSKIKANPGEIGKIKEAADTINNWKDWSLAGVNDLKQIIGELTKFSKEGAITQSKSTTLGKLYHSIDEIVKKGLPKNVREEYVKANKFFSENIGLYNQMETAFNSGDPFKKLAQVFSQNNDAMRQLLKIYQEKSGEPIMSTIAGRAIGTKETFALFNPRSYLDAILSPRAQGKIITTAKELQTKTQPVRDRISGNPLMSRFK